MSEKELAKLEKNIQKLNEKLIPEIIKKVNISKQGEISKNLEESLKKKYRKLLLYSIQEENTLLFDLTLDEIRKDWIQKSEEQIIEDSIYDLALEKIKSASEEAEELARKKEKEKIPFTDKETFDRLIKIWEENQNKVKSWNQKECELEISEGYIDLNYAYGFSDCISLRLSKYLGGK